jgi:hypothetical protein
VSIRLLGGPRLGSHEMSGGQGIGGWSGIWVPAARRSGVPSRAVLALVTDYVSGINSVLHQSPFTGSRSAGHAARCVMLQARKLVLYPRPYAGEVLGAVLAFSTRMARIADFELPPPVMTGSIPMCEGVIWIRDIWRRVRFMAHWYEFEADLRRFVADEDSRCAPGALPAGGNPKGTGDVDSRDLVAPAEAKRRVRQCTDSKFCLQRS